MIYFIIESVTHPLCVCGGCSFKYMQVEGHKVESQPIIICVSVCVCECISEGERERENIFIFLSILPLLLAANRIGNFIQVHSSLLL